MTKPNRGGMYQNAYRNELDKDDETSEDKATDQQNPDPESATSAERPLSPEEKFHKERYDQLKAHYDKVVPTLRNDNAQLAAQLKQTSEKTLKLPKTPEEIEAWKAQFPEVYDTVKTISGMEADARSKTLEDKIKELSIRERNVALRDAQSVVSKAHPDFEQIKADPKFAEWAQEQPQVIREWLFDASYIDQPQYAVKAINMYKMEVGHKPAKSNTKTAEELRSEAAMAVGTTPSREQPSTPQGKKVWKLSEISKLKSHEFEKIEAELDLAAKEGRIVEG